MAIYIKSGNKLKSVQEKKFDLEEDIQRLTEDNLEIIFDLKFVSGFLNNEFSVTVQEQDFYIDTLAFNEHQNSFVIIEYKKDRNFSIIDQGFSYLSAMLRNKAEFVLELNRKLGKSFDKDDIDWEQSRLIFISPEFTNHQKNAINFNDLPFSLYEVKYYENGIVEYDPIKPFRTTESIQTFTKDKIIHDVSKEVKVYTVDDLIKPNWKITESLLSEFEKQLLISQNETKINYTQKYIAYLSKYKRNYVEIVPQRKGLKIYYRFPFNRVKSSLKIEDCSKVGHWTNGISFINLSEIEQIPEAVKIAKDSFLYTHKDIS
ncbi:MAG: type I restriction enzyme HsdR N-terminal domain-containing protein [Candidatus Parcubacteria bacterium]|nr:type I restriction enzyme HsdR N-terminal domain-containing protein [Candidatus Parcubacteria bacterium]